MEDFKRKVNRIVSNYNVLSESEKKRVAVKINEVWQHVYDEYMQLCSQDEELNQAYDMLKKAKEVGSFNLEDEFSVYAYTEDEFDSEMARDIYVYDEKLFAKAKHLAENYQTIQDELRKKIANLRAKKFVFNRLAKIEELEQQLSANERTLKHYNECMRKQAEKDYYTQNADTLIEPYKQIYSQKMQQYAKMVVEKYIQSDPIILCVPQNLYMSSSAYERSFDSKPLNNVCNSIRGELLFDIKRESEGRT